MLLFAVKEKDQDMLVLRSNIMNGLAEFETNSWDFDLDHTSMEQKGKSQWLQKEGINLYILKSSLLNSIHIKAFLKRVLTLYFATLKEVKLKGDTSIL